MNLPPTIKTVSGYSECRIKEKGSLFIGMCYPINSELETNEHLNKIRKKYYDATHNCYAYKFADGNTKYSDDGEPNGTAGIRILNAINHFDLKNILVVVTRYFGGTKLGVGLLGKTYYETAYECLKNSSQVSKTLYKKILITYQYELFNFIHRTILRYEAKIEKSYFDVQPSIECYVPSSKKEIFLSELHTRASDNLKIKEYATYIYL